MEDVEEFLHPVTKDTIIITPIATGSSSGTAKIIAAIAIVALVWWNPVGWAMAGGMAGSAAAAGTLGAGFSMVAAGASMSMMNLMLMGVAVSLATTGIQQLMAPDPSVDQNDTNYLFDGPENTVVSGSPVPILCGEMMVGGIVISSGVIGSNFLGDGTYVHNPGPDDVPTIFSTGNGTFDGFGSAATDGLIAAQQDALAEEALRLRYRGDVN